MQILYIFTEIHNEQSDSYIMGESKHVNNVVMNINSIKIIKVDDVTVYLHILICIFAHVYEFVVCNKIFIAHGLYECSFWIHALLYYILYT